MKIEYRDLVAMGATEKQLDTYSNTDPFTIRLDDDGTYSTTGAVEASGMTAETVLGLLNALAEEE
jgi:hypothetical protein